MTNRRNIFTLVAGTGSRLPQGTTASPVKSAPAAVSLLTRRPSLDTPPPGRRKRAAERAAESNVPWNPREVLDEEERLFRLFRWACQQESLGFATTPKNKHCFAEIIIPVNFGVSRELLLNLVNLLTMSEYDADAPEPKFGAEAKLLMRSKSARAK